MASTWHRRLATAAVALIVASSGCAATGEIREDRANEVARLCISVVERRAGRAEGPAAAIDRAELDAIAGIDAFRELFDSDRAPAYSGASALRRLCRPTSLP